MTPDEVAWAARSLATPIPDALWSELAGEGLVRV
jgi:hypothetical protein